jgi:hypothetical protein
MSRPLPLFCAILIAVVMLVRVVIQPVIVETNIDQPSVTLAAQMLTDSPRPLDPSSRAPGYPLLLAALAQSSTSALEGLHCLATPTPGCNASQFLTTIVIVQTVMELAALGLVAYIALRLSGSTNVALLTVVIAYFGTRYGKFNVVARPYVCYHLLSHCFLAATIWAAHKPSALRWLASGASLVMMTAFEPQSVIAAPILLALLSTVSWQPLVATATEQPTSASGRLYPMVAFTSGVCLASLAVASLCLRVRYPSGDWAAYLATNMAERVAFNDIDRPTWLAGMLLPVPFLGQFASVIAPEKSILQLSNYVPGAFVYDGITRIRIDSMADGRDGPGQLLWLIDTYIAGNPLGYALSTPTILNRGIWAGTNVVGLVGLFRLPQLLRWSRIEGRSGLLALAILPCLAIFLANTALTANLFVLNPLLPTLYCYAIAYIARST